MAYVHIWMKSTPFTCVSFLCYSLLSGFRAIDFRIRFLDLDVFSEELCNLALDFPSFLARSNTFLGAEGTCIKKWRHQTVDLDLFLVVP